MEPLLNNVVVILAMLQDAMDGRSKDGPHHLRDILLQFLIKLLGQGHDLRAVDKLGNREMGLALAIGRALQDVDERLRDIELVGKLHSGS